MSIILGLNCYHADSSAAIFDSGKLKFAIEEEKLVRKKHWAGFPANSIIKCINSIDHKNKNLNIAINTNPKSNIAFKSIFFLKNYILGKKKGEIFKRLKYKFSIRKEIEKILPSEFKLNFNYIDHHVAHIASSFYASKFEEAIGISIDGFGDFASLNIAKCNVNEIKIVEKVYFPNSLGVFYEAMTQLLGFPNYGDEYKLMGLSSYGKPIFFEKISNTLFDKSNLFKLNLKYFNHHKSNFSYIFENDPKQNFLFNKEIFKIFSKDEISVNKKDIAASVQKVYENFLIKIINFSLKKFPSKSLCLSGGCALNSVANGKILSNTNVDNLFIPFAPGDSGGAIGSAMVLGKKIDKKIKFSNIQNPYLGPEYDNDYIGKEIVKFTNRSFNVKKIDDFSLLCKNIAYELTQRKIIGWFQGRLEFGARALGNRSILADPRYAEIRDLINSKIKRRESFRPFAPSIMEEFKDKWFDGNFMNPYMETVLKIKNEKKKIVPAVVHIDSSCRLQTVSKKNNLKFYELINQFNLLTKVPILLNTSFNENEPIVCTPYEALKCFERTDMDILVLENYLISRG